MTGQLPPDVVRRGRSGGWAPALRIARRELLRAKGRTLLVLLMVLLPVTGVVALDTLLRTADVRPAESLSRDLGTAQARITQDGAGPVLQSPDGSQQQSSATAAGASPPRVTEPELLAALPAGARLLPVVEGPVAQRVRTTDGRVARVTLVGVDLTDPSRRGPFALRTGRAPSTPDEVAVTASLARFGFPVGSTLRLPGGEPRTVTGTVAQPDSYGYTYAVYGSPAAVGVLGRPASRWYVHGPAVPWSSVQQVNALGGVVLSRAVVEDPPPDDQVPDLSGYTDHTTAALVGLIVVIAVLEVVLLAGPAFAVGARRQRRALALLAAGGGEPRHVRRVVLAQGLLVGVTAAVVSAGLGVGLAAGAVPVLQRHTAAGFGPFETSPRDIALFCLLGAVTAVLAALVPAALAARQPVVAALQGRRVVPGRTGLPTVAGLVLLVVGVLACRASLDKGSAELWVAFSAVPTVLGAALLAPALLALVGRSAARLPLPLRYAVRDADRQRGRTAPAVAAIAATVAAVVALGTSSWSDAAENATRYGPTGPVGTAVVTQFDPAEVPALTAAAGRALPGEPVLVVRGLQAAQGGPDGPQPAVLVCRPDEPAAASCNGFASQYGYLGGDVLVGADGLRAVAPLLQPAGLVQARRALAAGSAVVVGAPAGGQVSLRRVLQRFDPRTGQESAQLLASVTTRAVPLQSRSGTAPVQAVVPDAVAARLGGVGPVSVLVGDDLSKGQERTLRRALTRLDTGTETQVDRGQDDQGRLVLLLLGGVAGFLVLAGTLAASSLALTEARPDLATMGQVGARPRTRRQVAGAYAFVLALVGAVLGCLAGLVPGVAGAVAITRDSYAGAPGGLLTSTLPTGSLHFVRVPWLLLLALVVGLPLLAGAVAALTTRSRLPGVGRRLQP